MMVQQMIFRVPGWVTVVSLCCFCNVALIFATMKTFILQQVKCCHLSYSNKFPHSTLFIASLFFSCPMSYPQLPSSLVFLFQRSLHLSCGLSFSDSLYVSKWSSLVGLLFLGVWSRGIQHFTSVYIFSSLLWVHSY